MAKSSLEDKIHDRLIDHKVDIDNDALWASLGMDEEKKDKKGGWVWILNGLLLLAFIGLSGLGYVYFKESPKSTQLSSLEKVENLNGQQLQTETVTSEFEKASKTEADHKTTKLPTEASIQKSLKATTIKNTSNRSSEVNTIVSEKSNSKDEDDSAKKNSVTNLIIKSSNENDLQNNPEINRASAYEKSEQSLNYFPNRENANTQNKKDATPILDNESLPSKDNISRALFTIPFLSLKGNIAPLNKANKLDLISSAKITPVRINGVNSGKSLSIYTGVNQVNKVLRLLDPAKSEALERRLESEKQLEQFYFGGDIKLPIYDGIYGKAGLRYDVISDKSTFSIVDSSNNVSEIEASISSNFLGFRNDEIVKESSGTTLTLIFYNQLKWVSLPLALGYEKNMGRFSIFGEGTALINIIQSYSGELENPILALDPAPIFKRRHSISYNLSAGFDYQLSPTVSTFVKANYFVTPNSITKEKYGIEQKYSSYGISLGMNFTI